MCHSGVLINHICNVWTVSSLNHGIWSVYCHLQPFMSFSCLENSVIESLLAHTFMNSLWVLYRQWWHSTCPFVTSIWSTTSTVMMFPWLLWPVWYSSQRTAVGNHFWVQCPLLATDSDHFLFPHHLCHTKDPFCWRKTESFSYLCFPSDLHHNILWDNHFYVPTSQVKPFCEHINLFWCFMW